MNKLVDIVKNTVRSVALVGAMALTLNSCHKIDDPVLVAYADVSPPSGVAPLSSRIKGYGTDSKGVDDIKLYDLNINGKDSTSNSPFDFVKTFSVPGIYNIFVVVTDSHGAASKSKVVTVDVSSPVNVPSTCSINFLSSTSGDSPLNLPLKTSGTSGTDHIIGYKLHVDDRVSSLKHSVIDTTLILYAGSHTVSAEAVTASGASVSSSSYNVKVNFVRGPNDEWYMLPFIPLPKGPLNLFAPRDNTPAALEYDAASPSQRNALNASRVNASWLAHYPSSDIPPVFDCNNYTRCALVGSIKSLGTNLYYNNGDFKLFDWYSGNDSTLIGIHGGTFYGAGDLGLPMIELGLVPTDGLSTEGHATVAVISGDDLSDASINKIDFQYNITNVKPNQSYFQRSWTGYYAYPYTYTTTEGGVTKNHLTDICVMIVDYAKGVPSNVRYNPNIELVKTRNGK